jgi:hypothetical protein
MAGLGPDRPGHLQVAASTLPVQLGAIVRDVRERRPEAALDLIRREPRQALWLTVIGERLVDRLGA